MILFPGLLLRPEDYLNYRVPAGSKRPGSKWEFMALLTAGARSWRDESGAVLLSGCCRGWLGEKEGGKERLEVGHISAFQG